ncbi:carbon-nitrogen hydrolase family protein [Janthinobacterium sp. 17J80-10]|nr:carbon-nitrogen hydrolase family protein [Janthinobacterium sp. 17J80-10]
MKVGLLQTCATPDVHANRARVVAQIRQASALGADLIAMPEAVDFLHPDPREFARYAQPMAAHEFLALLQSTASELRVWLLAGSLTTRNDLGQPVNRTILIAPDGKVSAWYDKIHLFDAAATKNAVLESSIFSRGKTGVVATIGEVALGLSICYDVRFPYLYRALALHGANVMCVPAAFMKVTGEAHWHALLRARAIETGSYVIAPAQYGSPHDGRESYGRSLVVNPWGEVVAEAGGDAQVITADIDLALVAEARRRIPSLVQTKDFDVIKIRASHD